jgi:NADPH2:quinone reductase
VRLPDGLSFEDAASVMLKGLTAQYLVTSTYAVQRGDVVLVHAAAGGVGLLLGQWLHALGAIAIGTAGSPEKIALARANGYTHLIDYRSEEFSAKVHEITAGNGCAVVYDSVGSDTWRGSLKCLRRRGMFVSFGQSSGAIEAFKLADLAAGGSLFATRPTLFDYIASRADLESRAADLFARLERGTLRTHVGQRLALRDAAEAHRLLESRATVGATLLVP